MESTAAMGAMVMCTVCVSSSSFPSCMNYIRGSEPRLAPRESARACALARARERERTLASTVTSQLCASGGGMPVRESSFHASHGGSAGEL